MKALVSIHDVMPDTLGQVCQIVGAMPVSIRDNLQLLVVPGLNWRDEQIQQLHQWQQQGMTLVGHGWTHRADSISTLWHRLHARLISRDVAEHLSLTAGEELALMERNYRWFSDHGLTAGAWYVPPAWAFGRLPRAQRAESGYRYFESTFGVYDAMEKRFNWLPMLGYEADTRARCLSVRLWNAANRRLARHRTVRLAIHPHDFDLPLAADLRSDLARITVPATTPRYHESEIRREFVC